jgi:hypothetical protein
VYDAEIAEPGIFNLMIHTNYTPIGRKVADYPGGIIPDHSVNGAAEWAYGVADWFEQGLYLPVWTPYSQGRGGSIDGFKIRELFVRPHAKDHTFFYGLNFELSVNYHYWEPRRVTSELRPIVGLHLHPVDFIFNPIVDTQYRGGIGNLEFVPATRIAYNLNDKWAVWPAAPIQSHRRAVSRSLGRCGSSRQVDQYRDRRRGGRDWRSR